MAGNALRCMAKYLYDNHIVSKEEMTIETDKGTKTVQAVSYTHLDVYKRQAQGIRRKQVLKLLPFR